MLSVWWFVFATTERKKRRKALETEIRKNAYLYVNYLHVLCQEVEDQSHRLT